MLFKAAVTTTLVAYLVRSGALDFSALALLGTEPLLAAATLINWVLVSVVLGAWRYKTLLSAMNIHITGTKASYLQLGSLFLNTVVPGSIGGDIWKSLAVAKVHTDRRQMLLFMLLIERGIGLSALMSASCLIWLFARLANAEAALPNEHLVWWFATLSAGLIGIPFVALMALEWRVGWLRLQSYAGGWPRLKTMVDGVIGLRGQRQYLVRAYIISMAMHFLCMVYFFLLCKMLPGASIDIDSVAMVFPIGIMSVMLPVSLAGLGVGHLAFESLFASLGASGGANVFNLYLFGQVGPNILGAIPFVMARFPDQKGISS